MLRQCSRAVLGALLLLAPVSTLSAAPVPSVSVGVDDPQPFIGDSVRAEVTFDNTDSADTGYGPFADLVLPATGEDGDDGIDLAGGVSNATYLGTPVQTVTQVFPDDGGGTGCVDHPLAVDNSGAPLAVCGPAGDKLVTMELPFGSFVPDQPAATLEIELAVSDRADLGSPLDLRARGGFRFGGDALDNPTTDPSILGSAGSDPVSWTASQAVTPTLIELDKQYIGPEDETATGPNFPREYTIEVEVAPGQTVTDLEVTDVLPENMAYNGVVANPDGASVISEPPVGDAVSSPGNELTLRYGSLTGTASFTFAFFIPRTDAAGDPVIDPDTGDDVISANNARAVGDWDPVDNRDTGGTDIAVVDASGPEHTLTDKAVAIQKSARIVNDQGATGPSPGDTVEYTLEAQVSDFFSLDQLVIDDTLSDGQRFDDTFEPRLETAVHGVSTSGAMDASNFAVSGNFSDPGDGSTGDGTDGTTDIEFLLSQELSLRSGDGRFPGGCVPDGGTGSGNPPDCSVFDAGSTTVTLRFRAVIQEDFSDDAPSGDVSVDQGDALDNDVVVTGEILDTQENTAPTGSIEEDGSTAGLAIAFGGLDKQIHKVNGSDPAGSPIQVQPGDEVTYRLQYSMPTEDVEDFTLTDFLPRPVFDATEVSDTRDTAAVPAAGGWAYGPNHTFSAPDPTVTTDGGANNVVFDYGDYDRESSGSAEVDLLFTVTATDEPFADGLFLTNQVRSQQGSTQQKTSTADALAQIQLREPELAITKGVSASDNANSTISPGPGTEPVDGDLADADAGDTVTFVTTVENTGGAPAHDVVIQDQLPAALPAASCQVTTVEDGAGDALGYSGSSDALFGAGLVLTDPLAANDGTEGAPYSDDTALITINCTIANDVSPADNFDNTAEVQWSAAPGATPFAPKSDTASVTIAEPALQKAIDTIVPGSNAPDFTVGDIVTYRIDVTLPEGETQGVVLTDTMPEGLVVSSVSVDDSGFNGSVAASSVSGTGTSADPVVIDLGTVTTTDDNDTGNNRFSVTLEASVDDVVANSALDSAQGKINTVLLDYSGGSTVTASDNGQFVEPELQLTKTMTPATVDAGDSVSVQLLVENTGTAPAYDIEVTDVLNAHAPLFDLGSGVTDTSSNPDFTFDFTTPKVTYSSASGYALPAGDSVILTFQGTAATDVVSGSSYRNTADVTGDGQDGSPSSGIQRTTSGTDNEDVDIQSSAVSKTLGDTSENWTPGSDVAIGEVLTYQIVVDVPEGVTREQSGTAIIIDSLPAGFQYVTGTATIRVANVATTLNGASNGDLPGSATGIAPGVSGDPQVLSFDLGDLTNNDDDADTEQVVIELDALVLNDAANNRGDDKQNEAALNYRNRAGTDQSATDTHTATVVEPNLSVSKTADPATVEGNETVTFEVVVSNPSGANVTRAWDITLTDDLPARYDANYTLTSAVLSRGGTDVAACGGFGSGADDNVLSLDMACLGEAERYLAPGETVTLTYTADVAADIGFEEAVTNTVNVTGTSLAGGSGDYDAPGSGGTATGERTGSGSGANDINAMANATVTGKVPTITKTGGADLAVGDTTTMTLEVDVPVGETQGFEVTDDLPAGLVYTGDPITIDKPATDFTASKTPDSSPAEGTDPLVFDFGDIANTSGSAQSITISYEARVANVIDNQGGDTLTNTASVTYQDQGDSVEDTAEVKVLEPNLEIGKTITAGAAGSDAGDLVSYEITVTNNGNSTAHEVNLRDVLPPDLLGAPDGSGTAARFFGNVTVDDDGGAVTTSGGGSGLAETDKQFADSENAGDTLTWPAFDIPAGATLTITYDAVIDDFAFAGSILENTVSADYSSLPGEPADERTNADNGDDDDDSDLDNYGESAASSFTVDSALNVQKSLNTKHADNDFTIGDVITFDVRVDLVEGTVPDVRVRDDLPDGLTFVGPARIVAEDNISYAGSPDWTSLDWSLGDVTNAPDNDASNDYFVIEFDARVAEVPENVTGETLDNVAEVLSSGSSAGTDDAAVDVTEPSLVVEKVASDTTPSLGDSVTFTVTVSHDGDSTADAHDVQVTDVLPEGLTYVTGSHAGDGAVDAADPAQPVFELGTITQTEGAKSFTFEASVNATATVGAEMTNRVNLGYDGQPNDPDVERGYTGSGEEAVTPDADALIDAAKTVSLAVDDDGDGVVDPGDTLAYTITLTNGGPDVTGVVFTDPLPNDVQYVANSLSSDRGSVDDSGDPLRVTIGDLAAGETVTMSFRATVAEGTAEGTVIRNQGNVDSDQSVPEPTDEDGVDSNGDQPTDARVGGGGDSPDLYTVKSVQWHDDADDSGDITAGDTMRYRLVLENTSDVTLTNVTLSDALPDGLTFVPNSEAITGAGNTVTVAGGDVSATIPELTAGDTATIRFHATIDTFAEPSRSFVNQADTDSDQTPPGQSDGNGFPGDGNQPTSFDAVSGGPGTPALDLEKRVALAADNDADGVVSPGDTLRYRMTLANTGSGAANNVRLDDDIPADTSVVPGSVSTSRGIVIGENPVALNIGRLEAGARVTVAFRVTVDGNASDGTIISNQAEASSDELPDEPSDDNGSDGDGKNPNRTPVSDDPGGGGETSSGGPGLSKDLHASSDPATNGNAALIGEELTYRIAITVPPGQLDGVGLEDRLPAGLTYVPDTARLSRTFDTGLRSAVDPGGINAAASGDWVALEDGTDVRVDGGTLALELGGVINSDSDADAERYVLELQALVADVPTNEAGAQLDNAATLTYENALGQPEETGPEIVTVTVDEPNVTVTKTNGQQGVKVGETVTYEITVANRSTGIPVEGARITDTEPTGVDFLGVSCAGSGGGACTGPVDLATLQGPGVPVDLPPAASVTLSLEARITASAAGEVVNEAVVTMPPDLDNAGPGSDEDVDPVVFDPPSGIKTVSGDGRPLVEWRMVWINGGNVAALDAEVTDQVGEDVDFEAGSLTCEARGSSTVSQCVYDAEQREVRYTGSIGPDAGASNEAEADNEVVITFQVAVPGTVRTLENQACVRIDRAGDGDIDPGVVACTDDGNGEDAAPGGNDPTAWQRPVTSIPATNPWGLLVLALGLLSLVWWWMPESRRAGR